ncbi:hypothetical protein L2X99_12025 [Microbacterium sp. KUDC0406]|uniref:hypothetical protein n=1 Tax=Microbacterium sp. KUDC0406 TaxID=2909588 RepID=UPI001F1EB301|nr:hypothetical protein [Microbacterium sp. KUDC0406]UJP09170.1 hypothetical protein L2X99_12025 [Microbacterium sp. KUDC0406]
MSLVIAGTAGSTLLTGADAFWMAVIVADIVLHVVMIVRGPVKPGGPQNEVDNVRQGVREAPADLVAEISERRGAAIALLLSRGLIDADAAHRADACAPGELGLTMAPEVSRRTGVRQ